MNRDNNAIDYTVGLLGELWKQQPELRLGQLILNAVRPAEPCPEIFTIEDEQLLRKLSAFLETVD